MMAPLYMESLHFLTGKNSGVAKFQDIVESKVAIGAKNSGTELMVRDLTKHYNLNYSDFSPQYLSALQTGNKLLKGYIDAMFAMTGIKSPVAGFSQ